LHAIEQMVEDGITLKGRPRCAAVAVGAEI